MLNEEYSNWKDWNLCKGIEEYFKFSIPNTFALFETYNLLVKWKRFCSCLPKLNYLYEVYRNFTTLSNFINRPIPCLSPPQIFTFKQSKLYYGKLRIVRTKYYLVGLLLNVFSKYSYHKWNSISSYLHNLCSTNVLKMVCKHCQTERVQLFLLLMW